MHFDLSVLFLILLGIENRQIQRPEYSTSRLEGNAIGERHESKVDQLGYGPDLPVGYEGGCVKVGKFFLDLRDGASLHDAHGAQEK